MSRLRARPASLADAAARFVVHRDPTGTLVRLSLDGARTWDLATILPRYKRSFALAPHCRTGTLLGWPAAGVGGAPEDWKQPADDPDVQDNDPSDILRAVRVLP